MSRKCNCPKYNNKTQISINAKVQDYCKDLNLTNEQLREIMRIFLDNVKRGLAKKTHATSAVKCFNTYVQELPSGKEKGKYLALDLGGTNFRVLLIYLNMKETDVSKIYVVSKETMKGPGEKLFDTIAECLASFMKEHNVHKEKLPLGFTFSFPLTMLGLTKGVLERWTKGYTCSGVIGQDVVQMLQEAIARRKDIEIKICAVLNDTTGTLMACAWKNRNCKIGLIVGTGNNSCYLEKQSNVELFDAVNSGSGKVIINTESGAFGDDGSIDFVRTEIDKINDANTVNPNKQMYRKIRSNPIFTLVSCFIYSTTLLDLLLPSFEKMVSGMYLGETVRLILLRCIKDGVLFNGKDSAILQSKESLTTARLSEIESDSPGQFSNARKVLKEIEHGTDEDCANLRYICECVSCRSAHLASAIVATLLNKMAEPMVTVGIDGSVYRYHPRYHDLMMEKIAELVDPNIQFNLMLSVDGSGRGAALVAAVVSSEADLKKK